MTLLTSCAGLINKHMAAFTRNFSKVFLWRTNIILIGFSRKPIKRVQLAWQPHQANQMEVYWLVSLNYKLAIFRLFPKCACENNSCTCEKVIENCWTNWVRFIHGMVLLENKDATAWVFSGKYRDTQELVNISCTLAFVRKTVTITWVHAKDWQRLKSICHNFIHFNTILSNVAFVLSIKILINRSFASSSCGLDLCCW